ncbi:ROK family transcriptional regulator [Archangium violaceum]|uniref:ROK family transcriptional regulator n=1 Tax=Archangium violaceum TaxID=83451 RepID=UPI002B2C50CB|nr:ROK family transcriptional regulator [Archangium violaceum]
MPPSEHAEALTGNQSLIKRINSAAILRLVRQEAGLSRADLAKRSGLTKSTVSLLVQELIDEGWLCESEAPVSNAVGRRPTPLQLDPSRLALIGAEIGVDYLNVVACNLQGKLLGSCQQPYSPSDLGSTLTALAGLVAQQDASLCAQGWRVLGISVGVPGTVDVHGHRVGMVPNLGWHHQDIEQPLCKALKRAGVRQSPVKVLNEANAAALSEYVFGTGAQTNSLVYLSMGIGVGGGIVLGDRLHLGHDGTAGEVGHTVLQLDGPPCRCGSRGCAETFISQRAVSLDITGTPDPVLPIDELARRVAGGDATAVAAARRAGRYLGMLMQNICNMLDPAVLVLGGPMVQLGPVFLDAARECFAGLQARYAFHTTEVRHCRFGINACAVGAAGAVLHEALMA